MINHRLFSQKFIRRSQRAVRDTHVSGTNLSDTHDIRDARNIVPLELEGAKLPV